MTANQPNQINYIELPAPSSASIAQAKAFYGAAFGWTFKDWGEDYVDTQSSGVGSGLNADASHRPAKPLVVMYVLDLEVTRALVVDAGGTITKDIFAFPGGRRFHFVDPCGNELAAWSER